jgi:propanol-preferring alcohol dehydrogenase
MKAMILTRLAGLNENPDPLEEAELPVPRPGAGEILVKVDACGVCHTELDEIEGRTPPPRLPVIPGHEIVGRVAERGPGAARYPEGSRVGIGWIHSACLSCSFCRQGRENLCPQFSATGRDVPGGYAEYTVVNEDFAFPIPAEFSAARAAPLLCAGGVGYRSLMLAALSDGDNLGLTGFGASGHLVLQLARHLYPASRIFVFARSAGQREFALRLGAFWAGPAESEAPQKLKAVIDTTPAWKPVVEALGNLDRGGRLVINAIRKEEGDKQALTDLDYPRDLWLEKEIKSVANVTRDDIAAFLPLAAAAAIVPEIEVYGLKDANRALRDLKRGRARGAKVLIPGRGAEDPAQQGP